VLYLFCCDIHLLHLFCALFNFSPFFSSIKFNSFQYFQFCFVFLLCSLPFVLFWVNLLLFVLSQFASICFESILFLNSIQFFSIYSILFCVFALFSSICFEFYCSELCLQLLVLCPILFTFSLEFSISLLHSVPFVLMCSIIFFFSFINSILGSNLFWLSTLDILLTLQLHVN